MKKTWPVVSGILAVLIVGGIALGQMPRSTDNACVTDSKHMGCGRGMMGTEPKGTTSHTTTSGTIPCGMHDRSMMHNYLCCPMMTTHSVVDYFLSNSEAIELSGDQVKSLEAIRDSHRKERIQESAELEIAMMELDNLLNEDEIDLREASELNERIEAIRARVRFREIEALARAKRVLNRGQLERLRSLNAGSSQHENHHEMVHR